MLQSSEKQQAILAEQANQSLKNNKEKMLLQIKTILENEFLFYRKYIWICQHIESIIMFTKRMGFLTLNRETLIKSELKLYLLQSLNEISTAKMFQGLDYSINTISFYFYEKFLRLQWNLVIFDHFDDSQCSEQISKRFIIKTEKLVN